MKFYFMLPFVALAAWLGVQPRVSAGPVGFPSTPSLTIPPARGSFDLTAYDYSKQYCAGGVNTPIIFRARPDGEPNSRGRRFRCKGTDEPSAVPQGIRHSQGDGDGLDGECALDLFFWRGCTLRIYPCADNL